MGALHSVPGSSARGRAAARVEVGETEIAAPLLRMRLSGMTALAPDPAPAVRIHQASTTTAAGAGEVPTGNAASNSAGVQYPSAECNRSAL
jgi:hypothetical protein